MLPRAHAGWEEDAGIEEVVEIARAADRLGFSHLTCSEHVAVPAEAAEVRGARYWDPLATFGFLAAHTERIRLATHVLVLGYHHPLEIAKRYGTLDRICGGRLILGVGVGSLREEFDLLGASFDDRGARADESLRQLKASFGRQRPEPWPDMVVDPCGVQTEVPIWIGGRTRRSLRRAVELADGWAPFGLSVDGLAAMLRSVELPAGFEAVLTSERPLDPAGDPDATREELERLTDAGATVVNIRVVHNSCAHFIEQIEAAAQLAS